MNHTPGPWLRDGLTVYVLHHNGDYDKGKPRMVNRFSAHVEPCLYQGGNMVEAKANARLIQAAPELLSELKATNALCVQMAAVMLNPAVADYIPFGMAEQAATWLRTYGAAIAKAEGK